MEEGLKKIKLESDRISESEENTDTKQEGKSSVLVPKINLDEKEGESKKLRMRKPKIKFNKKSLKIIFSITGVVLVIFIITGLLAYRVYTKARKVETSARKLIAAADAQDFQLIKQELANTKEDTKNLQSAYKTISWMKILPYFGGFVKDGQHGINAALYGIDAAEVFAEVIEPYTDIIGFAPDGEKSEGNDETTQEKLDFVVKTIPDIIPRADELIGKISKVREEIDQINPSRYPMEFGGRPIREMVKNGVETVDMTAGLIENGKPLLEAAPYLLGIEDERTYLIIFQNDKELRPTGGFITAYSIAKINKGKFESVTSNDIYNLDKLYTPSIEAPEPLRKYIKGPYLITKNYRLRDMNWSPDFYESMTLFSKEAEEAGITDIDGIIAVDTHLLVNILDVLGIIHVEGYGGYSNDIVELCKCPQVVYELEHFADLEGPIVWSENEPGKIVFAPANYDNRKKIIGPMMNTMLSNVLGLPNNKIPALFNAITRSILEKHVLIYMFDDKVQDAIETFGIAGRIEDFDGDYLYINDANLGGRKSNLYVTQEVQQEIDISKDGTVEKTVTITYKNPEKYTGWLNSVLPNWVRIYVPKGSELIEFQGVEDKKEPYEELGKTVYAGYFELRPQGVSKVIVKYKLPFKVKDDYQLLLQKQPGKDAPLYGISLGKKTDEFFLRMDKELRYSI